MKNEITDARTRGKRASRYLAVFAGMWMVGVFLGGLRTNGSLLVTGISAILAFVSLWYVIRMDRKVARLEREAHERAQASTARPQDEQGAAR